MGARVRLTQTYARTVLAAASFLESQGAQPARVNELVESLVDKVAALLSEHPRLGREAARRSAGVKDAEQLRRRVLERLGNSGELRELILGDYLVLYVIRADIVDLMSVRHHRQATYELPEH